MEWNHTVPGLKEAVALVINAYDLTWTPVRKLLGVTIPKESVEYKQLQQIPVKNIIKEACSRGFTELVSIFLNSGVKANCTVDKVTDRRMLHFAAVNGHLSLLKLLLNVGVDIDCKAHDGKTSLFYAVQEYHLDVVKYLINAGCDINTCDKDGKTLLDAAYHYKTVTEEMLQLLLESGCDPNKCHSYCPLDLAVMCNNIKCVKMLLDAGANVNGTDTFIPLHKAARCGFIPIMELLLEYGADINARDMYGYTTLHLALFSEKLQSAKFLIEHGSLIDSVNNFKQTPLFLSVENRQFDIAMLLINSGADLNLCIYNTVLHTAVRVSAPIHVIEHLLECGADVTALYYNKTALQYVISYRDCSNDWNLQVAKLLLIYGSNHYVEDDHGNTVLHWTCRVGDVGLAEYLIYYGLDVDAKNTEGMKPYDIAKENGHNDIVKAIIHYHCNKYTSF